VLISAVHVPAFPAKAWLASSASSQQRPTSSGSPLQLGLLPFPVDEALLPGETKQVHLYEARFIQLFSDAAEKHGSCIGMLLFGDRGDVDAITPLLEVEEFRKEEFGVWAQLKCIGRARLLQVSMTDFEYASADVTLFYDGIGVEQTGTGTGAMASEEAADAATEGMKAGGALSRLEDEVREVHSSVADMNRRLQKADADGADGQPLERVEWGHELRDAASERFCSLDELLPRRRAVINSAGPDASPRETLTQSVDDSWVVDNEAEADRQLLSFTACTGLSVLERRRALGLDDTAERLTFALDRLREQQRRLAALVALSAVSVADE